MVVVTGLRAQPAQAVQIISPAPENPAVTTNIQTNLSQTGPLQVRDLDFATPALLYHKDKADWRQQHLSLGPREGKSDLSKPLWPAM